MKVLNNNCRNDISDQECYHCSMNGHITECPEKCEQFEPVMSQELMDHYKALSEHYNNKASRIVMEAYMLGQKDARKQRDSKQGDLISRQALIDKLSAKIKTPQSTIEIVHKLIPMIEALPSVEPKQGETVSLEAFKQVLWEREIAEQQLHELGYGLGEKIEPKQGEWTKGSVYHITGAYSCSVCGVDAPNYRKWNYCPNCGAKMKGEQE